MSTVRKTTKTTVSLIVLTIGLIMLMRWCGTKSEEFFLYMEYYLNSTKQIGGYHGSLIRISFWIMLIASGIDAVYREKGGIEILSSFGSPILFSVCIAVWALAVPPAEVNIFWFWIFYSLILLMCVRSSYKKLARIKGAAPYKIKQLLKSPPSKNDRDISLIDRSVLYAAQVVLFLDWLALLTSTIYFCVQHKYIFGL